MADNKRAAASELKRDIAAASRLLKRWGDYLDVMRIYEKREVKAREFLESFSQERRRRGRPPHEIDELMIWAYWLVEIAKKRGVSMRKARERVAEYSYFKNRFSVHQIERWHTKVMTLPPDARGWLPPSFHNSFNAFLDKQEGKPARPKVPQ
jgi:hypothetical protein